MSTRVTITGDKKLISALRKFGKDGVKAIEDTVKFTAQGIEDNAKGFVKSNGTVISGNLGLNIASKQNDNKLNWIVISHAHYSAYIEFGTGSKNVSIPEVFKDQAALFKGEGIREGNITPKPFMYPAYLIAKKNYKADLQDNLDVLIEKFNR